MKKRSIILITIIFLIIFTSTCFAATVKRKPNFNIISGDRNLTFEYHQDIFQDYLWVNPPLYGKEVLFENNQATVTFAGSVLKFTHQADSSIIMYEAENSVTSIAVTTPGDHYYNRDILEWKIEMRQKYVPVSKWVTETVPVHKTRWVTERVPVQKTRTVYDSMSNSHRTEYYTDWETRTWPETYTEFESRQVLKTVWEWQSVPERILDIPQYTVYQFPLQNGGQVMLYVVADETGRHYFFQHISYCLANDKFPGFLGIKIPVQLVLIDGDQDGFFDGPGDYLMYNTWNPYDLQQKYAPILYYQDNGWIQLQQLAEEFFQTIKVDPVSRQLNVIDANTPFLKNNSWGTIIISNLPAQGRLVINGHQYKYGKKGVFKAKIEHGRYKAVISQKGHFDQIINFLIDKDNPTFQGEYVEQPLAATLTLINHGFRAWQLTAIDDNGKEWHVFNDDTLALPGGNYRFVVSDGGNSFFKEATIQEGEEWVYDFTADSLEKRITEKI